MTANRSVLIVLLMVVIVTATPRCKSQTSKEQRVFDAETLAVDRPVPIPPEVLALLSKDSDVKQVLEAQSPTRALPEDWFSASRLFKGSSNEKLYLVIGKGPIAGAHGTTFWLVGTDKGNGRPTVLLKITADRLEIGGTGGSGYPKITAVRFTAKSMNDAVYHFVAGKYVLFHPEK